MSSCAKFQMFFSLEMLLTYIKCVYVHAQIPNVCVCFVLFCFVFLVFKVLILE